MSARDSGENPIFGDGGVSKIIQNGSTLTLGMLFPQSFGQSITFCNFKILPGGDFEKCK